MKELKTDKNNLKKFGIFMRIALLAGLKSLCISWMKSVSILGWISSRLILSIIFYLVLAPIGLGMKLLGVDLLDRRIDKGEKSYWRKKELKPLSPADYERPF